MAEHPRLEELRRRVLADPASIAFAALAEEYRRSGSYEEAIETCRTGLQRHPSYLSARVTLGRALIETAQYDEARAELELVLKTAPENLAAIRGLAEIHERLGDHADHALVAEAAHQSAAVPVPSIPVPAVPESPIADWLLPPKPVAAPPSAPAVSPAAAPSPLVGAVATPASSPVAVAPTPIALSAASAAPPVAESIPVAPPARAPIPIAAAASAPAAAAAGTT
ncbi:MAG: tetratricopeptide repeat protein, partial [Acidobacteria bacterium]|nr:tetratricopeptide repeat protein [Acidobacteriota bacterium]